MAPEANVMVGHSVKHPNEEASIIIGCEWMIDAHGCEPSHLRDMALMRRICQRVIDDLALNVVGQPQWHQFAGQAGVTGLYLLSESHLACHTYPEHQLATFNLYCCRSRPAWDWQHELRQALNARQVKILETTRGGNGDTLAVNSRACLLPGKEPL